MGGPLVCAGLVLAGCNSAVDRAGGGGDPQPTVLRMSTRSSASRRSRSSTQ
jgi:hypothetical protein